MLSMPLAARGAPPNPSLTHASLVFAGLWDAVWQHRRRTLLALALLMLAKTAAVGVPLLLKAVIDRFSGAAGAPTPAAEGALLVFSRGGLALTP